MALLSVTIAPEAAAPQPAPEAASVAVAPEAAPAPAPEPAPPEPAPVAAPAPAPAPQPATAEVVAPQPKAAAAPAVQPRVSPPMVVPAPSTPAHWEPERPDALRGRWLVVTSLGLGAASWGLTFGQVGMIRGCSARLDGDLEFTAGDCLYSDRNVAALGGLRALTNVSNWGVAATAGAIKGNYDAIDHVWTRRAPRRSGLWIGGGIGLALAGMTTGAIAASMTFGDRTCTGTSCDRNLAGYLIASQAAQSMFTAGVGMTAYGMVYHYEYKDNLSYKNRLATMRAAPVLTADFAGASISGRF
ncbi:MAG: hypothetical protein ACE37F_05950 [Nannocystaceae bacterium]|nr:hypothetical protein [bacterium]